MDEPTPTPEVNPTPPEAPAAEAPPPRRKFNLEVKDLQLKQAPMEAVVTRDT